MTYRKRFFDMFKPHKTMRQRFLNMFIRRSRSRNMVDPLNNSRHNPLNNFSPSQGFGPPFYSTPGVNYPSGSNRRTNKGSNSQGSFKLKNRVVKKKKKNIEDSEDDVTLNKLLSVQMVEFPNILNELKTNRKKVSHWAWWYFPQIKQVKRTLITHMLQIIINT